MKKALSLILAILFISSLALASCGSDDALPKVGRRKTDEKTTQDTSVEVADDGEVTLEGVWTGDVPYGRILDIRIDAGDTDAYETKMYFTNRNFDFSDYHVTMWFEFSDDGTLKVTADEEGADRMIRSMFSDFTEQLKSYYEMTESEILEYFGDGATTISELFEKYVKYTDISDFNAEGSYEYEEGKLTLDGAEFVVNLSAKALMFKQIRSDFDEGSKISFIEDLIPLTLKKQK